MWFGKATLDAYVFATELDVRRLGGSPPKEDRRRGFEYDFGALDDADNPFTKSSTNLMYDRLPL